MIDLTHISMTVHRHSKQYIDSNMIAPNNMMVSCYNRGAGKGNGGAGGWWPTASSIERKMGVVASPGCEQRRNELLRG